MLNLHVLGTGHTRFAAQPERSLEDLMVDAGREALRESGLDPTDIDAIEVGHFNAGMVPEAFPASLALSIDAALRWVPCARHENACASGSAALAAAVHRLQSGAARAVLVLGVEKMSGVDLPAVTRALGQARAPEDGDDFGVSFPGVFAHATLAYEARHGSVQDALARIACKNHANGAQNPLAQLRKPLDFEFCREVSERNPVIVHPLKRTDCSPVSDGAAALVLTTADRLPAGRATVRLRAMAQVNDWLSLRRRSLCDFDGPRRAFAEAFKLAGVALEGLDFVEVHDCFTFAELLAYEAMGLCAPGEGRRAIDEGWVLPEGRLPVNVSGGLKAKGHPVGATGVSMHVMAARQLLGRANGVQLAAPSMGAVFNMGGAAVANYVTVLEGVP